MSAMEPATAPSVSHKPGNCKGLILLRVAQLIFGDRLLIQDAAQFLFSSTSDSFVLSV
jgi:hypothetical protein